jgi:hypothetical protein
VKCKRILFDLSLMASEQRVELNPRHIGLGYVRNVAPCTLCHGFLRSGLITGLRVMAEGKETPPIGFGESLAVLHRYVHAVICSVEKASPGRLGARAIRESWIEQAGQFLHEHGAFRE